MFPNVTFSIVSQCVFGENKIYFNKKSKCIPDDRQIY